jgi:hypothetical protein
LFEAAALFIIVDRHPLIICVMTASISAPAGLRALRICLQVHANASMHIIRSLQALHACAVSIDPLD